MITQILLQQTIIMFLLMMLGLLLSRRGMITEQGSRDLSNVLLYAVIPCVILRSYMSEFSMDKLRAMSISAVIAVIAFIASIGVAYLICGTRHRIENFAVAFGNAGFIGIPLVTAVFGTEAAFYVVSYSTLVNLLQWTYGIVIISGKKGNHQSENGVRQPGFHFHGNRSYPVCDSADTALGRHRHDRLHCGRQYCSGDDHSRFLPVQSTPARSVCECKAVRCLCCASACRSGGDGAHLPAVSLCARRNHADYADRSGNARLPAAQLSSRRNSIRITGRRCRMYACPPILSVATLPAGHAGGRAISLLKFQI